MLHTLLSKTKTTSTQASDPVDHFPTKESVLELLNNRTFTVNDEPYRHVVVDDIFPEVLNRDIYRYIKDNVYRKGFGETARTDRFSRFGKYDAYGWSPNPRAEHPARIFFSVGWKNLFANLFKIKITDDTIINFHYHKPYSENGAVHNDYAACVFKDDPLTSGINPWHHQCEHQTELDQPDTFRRVRSIALIYYLSTEAWFPEDGGETGLYSAKNSTTPDKKIAPINNRLLAFEVSPRSYHGFMENKGSKRINVVQWFHVTLEAATERFGITPRYVNNASGEYES